MRNRGQHVGFQEQLARSNGQVRFPLQRLLLGVGQSRTFMYYSPWSLATTRYDFFFWYCIVFTTFVRAFLRTIKFQRDTNTRTVHEFMEGGQLERDEQEKAALVHLNFSAPTAVPVHAL
jgi:hypothetical protein